MLAQLLGGLETVRDENLLVGYDKSDDASVYRVSDELAIVNHGGLLPPHRGRPLHLWAHRGHQRPVRRVRHGRRTEAGAEYSGHPPGHAGGAVREILRGGCDAAFEAGAIITGGHSIFLAEPVYGLAVTGFVRPDRLLRNCGALPGDALILTKPLGVGIVMTGQKAGLADARAVEAAVRQMTALNRAAPGRDAPLSRARLHRCDRISLMGHALEMAQGSA